MALRSQFASRNCRDENTEAPVWNSEAPGPGHAHFVVGGAYLPDPGAGWAVEGQTQPLRSYSVLKGSPLPVDGAGEFRCCTGKPAPLQSTGHGGVQDLCVELAWLCWGKSSCCKSFFK